MRTATAILLLLSIAGADPLSDALTALRTAPAEKRAVAVQSALALQPDM